MFGLNDNPQNNNDHPADPVANSTGSEPVASPSGAVMPDSPASSSTATDESSSASSVGSSTSGNDDLMDLKQQALQNLQPLVGHLDQTPEERFKTTMMLIQATDNSSLVKQAYEAANQITDEKARAQALLDVVNEINYFTQHGAKPEAAEA